jgi:hypothetical protein
MYPVSRRAQQQPNGKCPMMSSASAQHQQQQQLTTSGSSSCQQQQQQQLGPAFCLSPTRPDEWEVDRAEIQMNNKLGMGQYGDVYEALWLRFGSTVAVKTLKVAWD